MAEKVLLSSEQVAKTLRRLTDEIIAAAKKMDKPVAVVGIKTRGAVLAERIAVALEKELDEKIGRGALDITLYRDDIKSGRIQPMVRGTELNFPVESTSIILVDDVLYTGRTVRAAIDLLVDFGRPRCVRLATVIDRGLRELPICADFVGEKVDTAPDEFVRVHLSEVDGRDEVVVERIT